MGNDGNMWQTCWDWMRLISIMIIKLHLLGKRSDQQQPTTTNNNQQQPTTTNNNQQQPTTTNNNQQQPSIQGLDLERNGRIESIGRWSMGSMSFSREGVRWRTESDFNVVKSVVKSPQTSTKVPYVYIYIYHQFPGKLEYQLVSCMGCIFAFCGDFAMASHQYCAVKDLVPNHAEPLARWKPPNIHQDLCISQDHFHSGIVAPEKQ